MYQQVISAEDELILDNSSLFINPTLLPSHLRPKTLSYYFPFSP